MFIKIYILFFYRIKKIN